MGLADKNKKNAIDEMLATPNVRALFPANSKFMWSQKPHIDYETRTENGQYELYLIKTLPGGKKSRLEGDVVDNASAPPVIIQKITKKKFYNSFIGRQWYAS